MKTLYTHLLRRTGMGIALALLLALAIASPTLAQKELITNGDFETGTFAGWHVADQANPADTLGQDHFYLSVPGTDTPPVNGITFATAPNPLGGDFYAVSTSDFPGAHALLQDFSVPAGTAKVSLSFQLFVNDQSQIGPVVDPSGLDYTSGGTGKDNQHARVDLLRGGAGDLSTAPADILANFYLGVDNPGGGVPNPYLDYNFDITGLVGGGGTYRLRFAEVDNLSALNVGVDNVQVLASPIVPEAGSLPLLVSGLGGAVLALWRVRRPRRVPSAVSSR